MAEVTTVGPRPTATAAPATTAAPGTHRIERVVDVLTLPVTVVQRLLPDNPVPVALGAGALAIAGVVEWPAAVAIGLGYLALSRWHRAGDGRPSPAAGRG